MCILCTRDPLETERGAMSVYGGDSWGREAHHRKTRVNDLFSGDHSSYRKLSSGKYACLVCPHNPLIDTPLMLSIHAKSKRHLAAESKLKQREEERRHEMNKRIALSVDSISMNKTAHTSTSTKQANLASKPLTEKTRWATFEVLHHSQPEQGTAVNSQTTCPNSDKAPYDLTNSSFVRTEATGNDVVQLPLDYRERRERELKFTAAGWKHDCHGGWFRDENVEFDSDEEDPNEYFANCK